MEESEMNNGFISGGGTRDRVTLDVRHRVVV